MPVKPFAPTAATVVALAIVALSASFAAGATADVKLVYDHREGSWTGTPPGTELAAGWPGVPTVYLRQGEKLQVRIVDTNPLLYAVTSVSVKEEDTQLLKSLQDLASLLGGVLQAALRGQPSPQKGLAVSLPDAVVEAMQNLQSSLGRVRDQLNHLALARDTALLLVQRAEFTQLEKSEYERSIWGETPATTPGLQDPIARIAAVAASFSRLRKDKDRLESLDFRCMLPQLKEVVAATKLADGDLDDIEKVSPKAELWRGLATQELVGCGTDDLAVSEGKELQGRLADLAAAFSRLRRSLASVATAKTKLEAAEKAGSQPGIADAKKKVAEAQEQLDKVKKSAADERDAIDADTKERLLSLGDGLDQTLKAEGELLAKSDDARKAAANLVAFDLRRKAAAEAGWQIVVPTPATGARWDKAQQYTVELKADSPYLDDVARNPHLKDVTLTYNVRWRGESVLGVGVGVTYTALEDHTWAALPLASDPTKLSPQVKTTETRAGELALFLNWRAVQTFRPETRTWKAKPGIEVGASVNGDKPGAFVGVSLEVLKVLRLAYGRTWQRVTVLDGQVAGVTVVQSDADVRTRQAFRQSWYASLTFALDSLSLFKKE